MRRILETTGRVIVGCLLCGTLHGSLAAQDSSSLETQLKSIFKVTHVEMVGNNVTDQGATVTVAKSNLLFETPVNQPVLCAATVKESGDQVASAMCRITMKSTGGFLQAGQRLFVTKIKAAITKDTVTVELTEGVDPNANPPAHPSFKTAVNFVFAKGYLAKADAGQVADEINKVLPLDSASPAAAQAAPAPEQPAAAAPTQCQIDLGMSEDQVKSILGPPTTQKQGVTPGSKVYTYDKKVTFQNGKVAAIE